MFRSEQMHYFEVNVPRESAWNVMNNIGSAPHVEFIDMNYDVAIFNRQYVDMVKRCDDSLAK